MEKTRAHVFVSGRVQGVFFRQKTKDQAESQCVTGWVKNLDDGRVEAVFEGDEDAVKMLVAFCKKGPMGPRLQIRLWIGRVSRENSKHSR